MEKTEDRAKTIGETIAANAKVAEDLCNKFWSHLEIEGGGRVQPSEALLATMFFQDSIRLAIPAEHFETAKAWAKFLHTTLDIKPVKDDALKPS